MNEFSASFVDKESLILKFWFETSEMAGFDVLEVWRSTSGEGGPYYELTGDAWGPAVMVSAMLSGVLVGRSLELLIGEQAFTVTFTGTNPLDATDVATQIEAATLGLLTVTPTSATRLAYSTTDVGSKARLEFTGGDAAPVLGLSVLPPSNRAYGTDARPRLVSGINAYSFEDVWGMGSYAYKTRLRNTTSSAVSEFSVPLSGNPTRAVTPDRLVRGWIRLVDVQGRPSDNRSILISARSTAHNVLIDGLTVDVGDTTVRTDTSGYASVLLLRGTKVTVGIAGTALVRDVTPPTDPTVDSFNLLDPSVGTDDAFAVQVPDINVAERADCS